MSSLGSGLHVESWLAQYDLPRIFLSSRHGDWFQLSETKRNTKLVLVSRQQYLEINKPNKQNVRLINLNNSASFSLKIIVDSLIDVRNKPLKHHSSKSVKLNTKLTLLTDANVPVRFRAEQRAKYSSLQLTANWITAERCLWHYFKLIWESPATEGTNFNWPTWIMGFIC